MSAPVRAAQASDADAIARVHVATWQHAYRDLLPATYLAELSVDKRRAMWTDSIARGFPTVLVAPGGDGVAGFCSIGPCRDSDAALGDQEIWAIYVAPEFWGSGAGRELWRAARARASELRAGRLTLWVFARNPRARRFYEQAGMTLEPGSSKTFELGGVVLEEVRYVLQLGEPR